MIYREQWAIDDESPERDGSRRWSDDIALGCGNVNPAVASLIGGGRLLIVAHDRADPARPYPRLDRIILRRRRGAIEAAGGAEENREDEGSAAQLPGCFRAVSSGHSVTMTQARITCSSGAVIVEKTQKSAPVGTLNACVLHAMVLYS